MKTSRIDGVKAPQHRGTPRSHLHRPAQRSLGVLRHAIALVEDDDLEGRRRAAVELLGTDGVRGEVFYLVPDDLDAALVARVHF